MTRMRKWSLGTAVLALLILVAGWLLLVSPKRAQADELRTQVTAQQSDNATLTSQIAELKAQKKNLPAQQAHLADVRQRIPQTPALPGLVRALSAIAAKSGVTLTTLTPLPPALPAVTTTAAAAAAKPVTVAPDGTVLQIINVTMQVDGSYYNLERFVNGLESLKRSVLVSGLNITVASSGGTTTAPAAAVGVSPTLQADITARVFMTALPPATTK